MVDHDGKPTPLGLQPFADSIDRVKIHSRCVANHNVGEIELGERYLFSWEPFEAGVPADVDDDIGLENIP